MPHKKNLTTTSLSASVQLIERRIYLIRGQKVMIDFDLAELYGVPTKQLNQQVTRNKKRFPEDFMFRLTKVETESLRSQFVTSNIERPRFAGKNENLRSQIVTSSSEQARIVALDPILRSQIATSNIGRGGRRHLPYAFTEQGVAMLSSVLNSEQAIEVNIAIMRAFVRLRQMLETNEELNRKFVAVIRKLSTHDKYFKVVFNELKRMTEKPRSSGRPIGFKGGS